MRFEVRRYHLVVIPENDEDNAYIEDTLGLKSDRQAIQLVRRNVIGLRCIAYLETFVAPVLNQEDQFKSKPLTNLPGEETVVIPSQSPGRND